MFGHETLRAYPMAIEFVAMAMKMIEASPKGHYDLMDQFKRASISIALNIAEGSGKPTDKDKKRFYGIARGSAMECAAIMDVMAHMGILPAPSREAGRDRLRSIVAILTSICRK